MPDMVLHCGDNDLCHLVRFAAVLCVTNIIVSAFIYIQEEFPVKTLSSGMLRHFDLSVVTDISKENIAFTFRVKQSRKRAV
jgi:hypothetical protein